MNQVVGAGVGVERDVFMRTLLRELATSLESVVGLQEASGYISLVGQSVGLQLNDTYTRALSLDKLSREQVADVMVDFKQRIGGDFHLIEQDEEKIVLGSRSCPFGEQVKGRESMCMLTSNMFGTVAARNLGYARVDLEETIARGATGCRVVVHLVPQPDDSGESSSLGREYFDDSGLVGRVPPAGSGDWMSLDLFRAITKLLPHPVLLATAGGRILAVNTAATRLVPELRAGADLFALADENTNGLRGHLGHWLRSGDPLPGSLKIKDSRGELIPFRCHGARATWWTGPEPAIQLHLTRLDHADQFVALSQQVRALNKEMAFRRAAEAEREHLLVAEQTGRIRLNRLYRLTAALAAAATPAAVVDAVHDTAPAALGARSVGLALHSERLVPSLGPADSLRAAAGDSWTDLDHGHAPTLPEQGPGPDATTGRADGVAGADAGGREAAPGSPTRVLRLPLEADGLSLGELSIDHDGGPPPDEAHVTAIAQQIAQALRRAGLYEHEHRLAERLQRSLLPVLPVIDGLDVAGRYAPGSDLVDVGGDWYDVHVLDGDHIGLTIGDVAGHGLSEATAMGQISAALRGIVLRHGRRPGAVLAELDHFLRAYHPGRMATACYLVLHRPSGTLHYARAGHLPPLLIHADGSSSFLDRALAPPLGMVNDVAYTESEARIAAGETLLLFTDGLVERRGEILDAGLERLTGLARRTAGLSADELCEVFLHHQPSADKPDDCALLALRATRPGA